MTRPRTCPHCKKPIPVQKGYRFDDSMNMVCGRCGEIVFPASKEAESKLEGKKRKGLGAKATVASWPHQQQYYGHGAYSGSKTGHGATKSGGGADY